MHFIELRRQAQALSTDQVAALRVTSVLKPSKMLIDAYTTEGCSTLPKDSEEMLTYVCQDCVEPAEPVESTAGSGSSDKGQACSGKSTMHYLQSLLSQQSNAAY